MSLHLALFLETTGCHYSGWRMPGAVQCSAGLMGYRSNRADR